MEYLLGRNMKPLSVGLNVNDSFGFLEGQIVKGCWEGGGISDLPRTKCRSILWVPLGQSEKAALSFLRFLKSLP